MHTRYLSILVLCLSAALSGCASSDHYHPSETAASGTSGVTVYGEIDTSISRVR